MLRRRNLTPLFIQVPSRGIKLNEPPNMDGTQNSHRIWQSDTVLLRSSNYYVNIRYIVIYVFQDN